MNINLLLHFDSIENIYCIFEFLLLQHAMYDFVDGEFQNFKRYKHNVRIIEERSTYSKKKKS